MWSLKPDVWHRAIFSWEVKSGRDALVKCYVDDKQINKKAAVLKNFIPEKAGLLLPGAARYISPSFDIGKKVH
ncbi:MAG: hypothetical protein L3J71_06175 [Victivallaceae bacterium]|nr:hypothetical protein [Victivallaceae bacterium]